jgi:hypothetical protein
LRTTIISSTRIRDHAATDLPLLAPNKKPPDKSSSGFYWHPKRDQKLTMRNTPTIKKIEFKKAGNSVHDYCKNFAVTPGL